MKRLIMAAAGLALVASAGTASAKTSHHKGAYASQGYVVQRNVNLRSGPLANPDYKYGPYPEYPQSPPGGGY
jgi:hypothetical protein